MTISRAATSQQVSKPGTKGRWSNNNKSTGTGRPRGAGQMAQRQTGRNQSGHNRLY
jgi:hypothetical protein